VYLSELCYGKKKEINSKDRLATILNDKSIKNKISKILKKQEIKSGNQYFYFK